MNNNCCLIIRILVVLCVSVIIFTSCAFKKEQMNANSIEDDNETQAPKPAIVNEINGTDETANTEGPEYTCEHYVVSYHIPGGFEYDSSYHNISGDLIDQINTDEFDSWTKITNVDCESGNIVKFVDYFNFDKL